MKCGYSFPHHKISKIKMKIILLLTVITQLNFVAFAQDSTTFEYNSIEEALINPEKVVRLNLSNQQLVFAPNIWKQFVNLQYLSLKNEHLSEVPEGLIELRSLKVLDLSGNDFINLPSNFFELRSLEELYLNDEKELNLDSAIH